MDSREDWSDEIGREDAQGNWALGNASSAKECRVAVELVMLCA